MSTTSIKATKAWPVLSAKAWLRLAGGLLLTLMLLAAFVFRDEILRASLDPKIPYQTYRLPPAPDYAKAAAWALLPARPLSPSAQDEPADVFFIHPTTYNGGEHWNGPIDHPRSRRQLERVMLPNYAGPFERVGRLFAPRYRQASLYAVLSLREDAREARAFAYGDIRAAFRTFMERFNQGRPFLIVGVEQGGGLAARLIRDEVVSDPRRLQRMVGAYLIETIAPAGDYGPGAAAPACNDRRQARCVVAYRSVPAGSVSVGQRLLHRALVWGVGDELDSLGDREALCVNPLSGAADGEAVSERRNLGAANATDLEWGVRPAFLPHQVAAQCVGGLLRVSRPPSPALKPAGGWADRLKAPGYQLFYADLEADARSRLVALESSPGFHLPATPIVMSIQVRRVPVMGR